MQCSKQPLQCAELEHVHAQEISCSPSTIPQTPLNSMPIYSSPIIYSSPVNLREEAKQPLTYKHSFASNLQWTSQELQDFSTTSDLILKELETRSKRKRTAEKKSHALKDLEQTSKAKKPKDGDKDQETTLTRWLKKSLTISQLPKSQKNTRRLSLNTPEVSRLFNDPNNKPRKRGLLYGSLRFANDSIQVGEYLSTYPLELFELFLDFFHLGKRTTYRPKSFLHWKWCLFFQNFVSSATS